MNILGKKKMDFPKIMHFSGHPIPYNGLRKLWAKKKLRPITNWQLGELTNASTSAQLGVWSPRDDLPELVDTVKQITILHSAFSKFRQKKIVDKKKF